MKTTAELQREAWNAILDRLGIADAFRYRVISESGRGDYASERERLFAGVSLDDWVEQIRGADEPGS